MRKSALKTKQANYQIDQSGKIEHTNRHTIVALANGSSATVKISTREKNKLILVMKQLDYPKQVYIYKIFGALIFILLTKLNIKHVTIDKEYPGHESVVKDTLIYLFLSNKDDLPNIGFDLVGKKCQAHIQALSTYQEKQKPTIIVKAEDILELFYERHKKGWRFRSGRNNP